MGKVLKSHYFQNRVLLTTKKKQSLLADAVSELKKQTGIDFLKVATGDEKETRRLEFKHHQEKLLEG